VDEIGAARTRLECQIEGTGIESVNVQQLADQNKGSFCGYGIPRSAIRVSNGEVEGPPRSASQAPRAHTVFPRPRRVTTYCSRTPPTIVRRQNEGAADSYHHGPHQDDGVHSQPNLVQKLSPNFIAP